MQAKESAPSKAQYNKSLAAAARTLREVARLIREAGRDIRNAAGHAPCVRVCRVLTDMRISGCNYAHRLETQAETFEAWLSTDDYLATHRKAVLRDVNRALRVLTNPNNQNQQGETKDDE